MVFYSDLDNTLIYSYKHNIGKEKRCVEIYEGREISFMTEYSYRLLQEVNRKALFLPVTTRTVPQYQRISLGIGIPKYALVCNGGILLENGESDLGWYEASREIVADCQQELHRAKQRLEGDADVNFEVRNIERLFLFTKSVHPERTVRNLQNTLDHLLVDVFSNGAKVYVVPKKLTKGTAVRRFQERLQKEAEISAVSQGYMQKGKISSNGFGKMFQKGRSGAGSMQEGQGRLQSGTELAVGTVAAGDSVFDIPMLLEADVAFMPKEMQVWKIEKEAAYYCGGGQVFSDFLLHSVNAFCHSG